MMNPELTFPRQVYFDRYLFQDWLTDQQDRRQNPKMDPISLGLPDLATKLNQRCWRQ